MARLINESLEMDKTSRKVSSLKQEWSFFSSVIHPECLLVFSITCEELQIG